MREKEYEREMVEMVRERQEESDKKRERERERRGERGKAREEGWNGARENRIPW